MVVQAWKAWDQELTIVVTTPAMTTRAWYPNRNGLKGLLLAAQRPATTADTSSHGNSISTCICIAVTLPQWPWLYVQGMTETPVLM